LRINMRTWKMVLIFGFIIEGGNVRLSHKTIINPKIN
jgi:hypothetical protein